MSEPKVGPPLWRRVALLVLAGVALHVAAPGLIALAGAAPRLRRIQPAWFALMAAAEVVSLAGAWSLMRIAVPGLSWRVAAASQLAGNAISRILPGGAAAGTAVTYRIWARSGVTSDRATSGLIVTSVVSTLTLLSLPAGALLVAAGGAPVPHGLLVVTAGVLAMAAALAALTTLLLFNDSVARRAQALLAAATRIVRRRRAPSGDLTHWLARRDEMRALLGHRWRSALAAAVLNWGFDIAALVLALAAVGSRPHVSLVVLAYVTGAILGMIPITPGGLGFVEAGLLGGLAVAGVPAADAVIAVLAYRIVSYWAPVVVGLAVYGRYRSTRPPGRPAALSQSSSEREADPEAGSTGGAVADVDR